MIIKPKCLLHCSIIALKTQNWRLENWSKYEKHEKVWSLWKEEELGVSLEIEDSLLSVNFFGEKFPANHNQGHCCHLPETLALPIVCLSGGGPLAHIRQQTAVHFFSSAWDFFLWLVCSRLCLSFVCVRVSIYVESRCRSGARRAPDLGACCCVFWRRRKEMAQIRGGARGNGFCS